MIEFKQGWLERWNRSCVCCGRLLWVKGSICSTLLKVSSRLLFIAITTALLGIVVKSQSQTLSQCNK